MRGVELGGEGGGRSDRGVTEEGGCCHSAWSGTEGSAVSHCKINPRTAGGPSCPLPPVFFRQ